MRAQGSYPYDAVGGGCFVTGRYEFAAGERCVVLDIDMDSLPPYGMLCLSERAVACMMNELGWERLSPELNEHLDELESEVERLRSTVEELADAMTGMVDVPAVKAALDVVARRVRGKDGIADWLDTLPKAGAR